MKTTISLATTAMATGRHLRKSALLAAGCLALAVAIPSFAAQPAALKPFTATYQANYMGLHGTGTMTLAPAGGDRWKYSLEIDSAVAQLSQNTVFEAAGGQWKPLSNSDSSMLLIRKSNKQATYDWNRKEARWSGDVKPSRRDPVALQDGDLSGLLIDLAVIRDAVPGKTLHYRFVEGGRAREHVYVVAPQTESVEVDGLGYDAMRVSRNDGNDQTVVWVASGVPTPIRILQREDGDDSTDLRLVEYKEAMQ